jgi:hypothetical protein
MQLGDTVKVFSSMSDYDGQTGRIVLIASAPGAPAPYVVRFGDALTEAFSERELVPLKPIETLWLSSVPLETHHAPHGAPSAIRIYLGRIIADRFMNAERRRMLRQPNMRTIHGIGSPCVQCGKTVCSHR